MDSKSHYFQLFANCIPVRGYARSTINDLQRGEIHIIPNDLEDLLKEYKGKSVAEVLQNFEPNDQETIVAYYDFLIQQQLGMFCELDELKLFPDLNLEFNLPATIHNAIIDIGEHLFDYQHIIQELDALGCQGVQLRIFRPIAHSLIQSLLDKFCESRTRSVELFLCYSPLLTDSVIQHLISSYPRLTNLVIHTSPHAVVCTQELSEEISFSFTTEELVDETHCGFIDPSYFSVNISHFTEALTANTCLNRKISIDQYGNIKNCPAMSVSYGHINKDSLLSIASNEAFTTSWYLKKDQISVCKHCEFRYVCSDCRAFRSNPLDLFSKPEKCKYDPFTATWNNI